MAHALGVLCAVIACACGQCGHDSHDDVMSNAATTTGDDYDLELQLSTVHKILSGY